MESDDEKEEEKPPEPPAKKRPRKPVVVKVNHDLSENSDDDLSYRRRTITLKPKRRQETSSSSSSSFSDENQSPKRTNRPPVPAFKRTQSKKKRSNIEETPDEDEEIPTDEDYNTDVEKMDESTLVEKSDRRMLKDEDLTQMTKNALEDERQRVQRIQERQSQLNNSTQITNDEETPVIVLDSQSQQAETAKDLPSLVFEFEPNSTRPLLSVLPELVAKMKPHQLDGTMFLWDNVYESVAQIKKAGPGTGCILAHHMGL